MGPRQPAAPEVDPQQREIELDLEAERLVDDPQYETMRDALEASGHPDADEILRRADEIRAERRRAPAPEEVEAAPQEPAPEGALDELLARPEVETVPEAGVPEGAPPAQEAAVPEVPEALEMGDRPSVMRGPDGALYAMVRAGDIIRDPDRMQFKRVTREGVTRRLPGEYSPHLAGTIDVTRLEGETGLFLENGYHRHLKALEAGEDTPVPVRIHEESTPEQARRRGALMNIAEGHATPTDAAKFIREEGIAPETLDEANIDLRRDVARLGLQLSNLPDDVFTRVATGELTERMGAAIGDSGLTEAGMRALEKLVRDKPDLTIQQVRELARFVEGAGETTESQETLFGTEELTRSNALEKAKLSASIKRRLARDKNLFKYVARPSRADRLEQTGAGEIELQKAKDLADAAAGLEELYTKLSTVTGPVSDALNEAAAELAAGGSEREILDRLYDEVVTAIESDPDVARVRGADPEQPDMLAERSPEYGRPAVPGEPEGPVEPWDPDPAEIRRAYDTFDASQHNVSFEEVLDYLPDVVRKRPWDSPIARRIRERRIREGKRPMTQEQHAVARAISDLAREKGLELRRERLSEGVERSGLEGPEPTGEVRETPSDRRQELEDRLEEIDRLTQAEGRDETPEEVAEILEILDELSPGTPTYDAPISVPRQPGQEGASGEVAEAQGEYNAIRRRFRPAFKHPDTGEIIEGSGETHIMVARDHPDEMRLLDEWDRETDNVGFVDEDGNFLTRAEAERQLPPEVPPESQAIANLGRRNVFGGRPGEVREASSEYEPGPDRFESRVAAAVRAAPFNAAPGRQWQGYLDNVEGGVSPVEADHIGLTEYLKENADTQLTRDEVQGFVAEHGIRLGESVRQGALGASPRIRELYDERAEARRWVTEEVNRLEELMRAHGYSGAEVLNMTGPNAELVAPLPKELDREWRDVMREVQDIADASRQSVSQLLEDVERAQASTRPMPDWIAGPVENAVARYHEVKARVDAARAEATHPEVLKQFRDVEDARAWEEDAKESYDAAVREHEQIEAKYEEFVLPGDYSNYREVLVTLDQPGGEFKGPHFSEPNVAVHLRLTDRETARGKALLVEEIQSDWAQRGRERGFRDREDRTELPPGTEMHEFTNTVGHWYQVVWSNASGRQGGVGMSAASPEEAVALAWKDLEHGMVPDMPLRRTKDWVGVALQRALDEAVAGDYDLLAWTTGAQQAERYNIGRVVDQLEWRRSGDDVRLIGHKDGESVFARTLKGAAEPGARFVLNEIEAPDATLEEAVGKNLAQQIRDTPDGGSGSASGKDLAIGAHGMRMFYDQIIPRELTKVLKRLGVRPEVERIGLPDELDEGLLEWTDREVHAVQITPELRGGVKAGPLRVMERTGQFGGPGGEVREQFGQEDMFGGTAPEGGGDQFDMGLEGPRPEGLTQAEGRAKATVDRLRPLIEGKAASPEQIEEYREALALLRRNEAMSDEEIALRSEPLPPEPDDTGDLFGGLEGPEPGGVREPGQGDLFHDEVTWGGRGQAESARERIRQENREILEKLAPERRLELVERAEEKLRENLLLDLVSQDIVIRDPQDIAPLIALYRSPRRENLSVLLFKDAGGGQRRLVGHMLVTTGEINSAGLSKEQAANLLDMIDKTGADATAFGHNHPSSDPTPSTEDKDFQDSVAGPLRERGIEVLGHVVVDHGEAVLMPGDDPHSPIAFRYDPGESIDWTMPVDKTAGPHKIANMVGKTAGTDGFSIMYGDTQHRPVALEMHQNGDVALLQEGDWLGERMGELGASTAFIVIDERNPLAADLE
ncbi:MAG: JAB domain-containing protein, partial [Gemmatimonadota bacterium]